MKVDFNSPVKRGQVLALIDPSSYQQALAQSKANLRSAMASNALAQLTVDRQHQLVAKKVVSQSDVDTAEAGFEQSQALLLTQQAAVQNAQLDLDRCTITSPIDGVVIFKAADVGKTVQASFSAPTLFVIAQDLRKMQIIAPISEVDIWAVKPGPGGDLHGRGAGGPDLPWIAPADPQPLYPLGQAGQPDAGRKQRQQHCDF